MIILETFGRRSHNTELANKHLLLMLMGFTLMQVLQTYGFPHLRTSPYPQAHSQLDDTLFKPKITKGELEAAKVMPDIIQRAIKKPKRGKSDGEALNLII